jgi:hypothetical protein
MKRLLLIVAALMALMSVQPAAFAAVPSSVNYQGYLTDASGQPVSGTVDMTFGFYTSPTGTDAPLWTETQSSVSVMNGIYSVSLGTVTPLNLPFDQQYWLGMKIGTDVEMIPRQPIVAVPYSLRSGCNPGDYLGCYTGAPGTRDKGVCKGGVRTCSADGAGFGACEGEVVPAAEVCYNSVDEDCDGQLDTGCAPQFCVPNTTRPCYSGAPATQGIGICHAGVETCNPEGSGYGACEGEVLPQAEVCDNIDNNCNGQVDEGFDLSGDLNNCGSCGHVCAQGQSCQSGVCQPSVPPDGTPCDDGNLCTENDVYQTGICVGTPRVCDDGVVCTDDVCDAGTGSCVHVPNNSSCDDGNWCNGVEVCNPGMGCQAGVPPSCDDGSLCTSDVCDAGTGCQHINLPDGTVCGSGLTCQGGACLSQ